MVRPNMEASVDLDLAGRAAVITGSSRGIGKHIALALAAEGCHVALSGRTAETLAVAAQEVRDRGVKAIAVQVDLTEGGASERLVAEAARQPEGATALIGTVSACHGALNLVRVDKA